MRILNSKLFTVSLLMLMSGFRNAVAQPVNTLQVVASLDGAWELSSGEPDEFVRRMFFDSGHAGHWQFSESELPIHVTYFVEDRELVFRHYTQEEKSTRSVVERRFQYQLTPQKLTLVDDKGMTTDWKKATLRDERIERPEYSILESIVTETTSVFTTKSRSGDGQLGLAIAIDLSRLAQRRGHQFWVTRRDDRDHRYCAWVTFFQDSRTAAKFAAAQGNEGNVMDVKMWTSLAGKK